MVHKATVVAIIIMTNQDSVVIPETTIKTIITIIMPLVVISAVAHAAVSSTSQPPHVMSEILAKEVKIATI